MIWERNMRPAAACLCADVPHDIARDAVASRQFIKQSPPSWSGADSCNIGFGQFAIPVGRAALWVLIAVSEHIRDIFGAGRPSKVRRSGVRSVAIAMRHIVFTARRWAMERLADKAMNLEGLTLPAKPKSDQPITVSPPDIQRPQAPCGRVPHPPQAGYFIPLSAGAWPPFLCHNQRVVDTTIKSKQIAGHAKAFEDALIAGGWQ